MRPLASQQFPDPTRLALVPFPNVRPNKIAGGSKPGIDATKGLPGEGFKRAWPPLIKMDDAVRKTIVVLFKGTH